MTVKSVLVRLRGDDSDLTRALLRSSAAAKTLAGNLEQSNDRTTMLVQSALALGPALVPIGAQAVPIVMGLTTQFTMAAAAAGTAALAFSGVGDALKAVNEYQMDPTEANLQKMREEMSQLGPAGRDFVRFLQELRPELQSLQDVAQAGMLPGVQESIEELMTMMPQMQRIVGTIADTMGDLAASAGADLAGPEWFAFFNYIENEARPILTEMGQTMGNFFQGIGNLMVAFDPLTHDFSQGFLRISESFEGWSRGLASTEGFANFVDYIRDTGPQVAETLGALAGAIVALVQAAAPVGAVALPVLEAVADVFTAFMDSPVGPILIGAAAGLSALSRAVALYNVANGSALVSAVGALAKSAPSLGALKGSTVTLSELGTVMYRAGQSAEYADAKTIAARESVKQLRPVAAAAASGVGMLALSMTDLDEKVGLSNTAMLGLGGSLLGPWGAAVGAAVGFTMDLAGANDSLVSAVHAADRAVSTSSLSFAEQKAAIQDARAEHAQYVQEMAYANAFAAGDFTDKVSGYMTKLSDMITNSGQESEDAINDMEDELYEMANGVSYSTQQWERQRDMIYENLNAMRALREERLRDANANLAFQGSVLDVEDRFKERRDLLAQLAEAQGRGVDTSRLTAAQGDLAEADTEAERKAARERVSAARQAMSEEAARNAEEIARLKEELADYKLTLDDSTRAGIEWEQLLLQVAANYNNLSDKQKNNDQTTKLARDTFIETAMALGKTREAAERYADKLLEIPPERKTKIAIDVGEANGQIVLLGKKLDWLARPRKARIIIAQEYAGDPRRTAPGLQEYATGGYTGNAPTGAVAGVVHGREFVMDAALTAMYRPFFEELHRTRRLPGYMNGGYVATPSSSVSNVVNNYGATGPLQVRGVLDTPWGPATVRSVARAVVNELVTQRGAAARNEAMGAVSFE